MAKTILLFQCVHQGQCEDTNDEEHDNIVALCVFRRFLIHYNPPSWSGYSDWFFLNGTVTYHLYYT
jgi:hypothetical protein